MASSTIQKINLPQAGFDEITGITTTDETSHYVTFAKPFQAPPYVVMSFYGASYNRRIHLTAVSQYGFTWTGAFLSAPSSAAAIRIHWIAL